MDRISPEHRSWNMSQIKGRDTQPEIAVRSLLHRMGFRFRTHVRELPGCPDIVLPKWRTVLFVHGCFWHRHNHCKFAYIPKSRKAFWEQKFDANVARDRRVLKNLKQTGWKVIRVWECEISDLERVGKKLRRQICN
jgi:DNA mismatch endonuclease, patch repair protein